MKPSGQVARARGEQHPKAKLSCAQVTEIRRALARGLSQGQVARRYGIAQPTVSKISRREIWGHLS